LAAADLARPHQGFAMQLAPLTFKSIRARAVVLKLKRPVAIRIGNIADWPLILIDLFTEEGIVGRSYLEPYTIKTMRYLVPALQDFGEMLKGRRVAPAELYEAAQMDHASPWRRFSRITLPLLMPNLLVVVVLALIRAVQVFDEVFVLTGGGPGSATLYVVQFIYQTAFAESIRLYGIAAAASLVLALALLALTLVQLRLSRRAVEGGAGARDA